MKAQRQPSANAMPACALRRGFACALLALIALAAALGCSLAFRSTAWGYFNQYDQNNAAQQDLPEYGESVAGNSIPDGTYVIDAGTSSHMCVIYNTAQDAYDFDNKWHATLTVSGGAMTVTFYLSKSYNYMYLDSAAEASRQTDETGLDDSAYTRGAPFEVNGSSGRKYVFQYTMSIPALNTPLPMATYDGGGADGIEWDIEGAKWFDRLVVFMPSAELANIISGKPATPVAPAATDGGNDDDTPAGTAQDTTEEGASAEAQAAASQAAAAAQEGQGGEASAQSAAAGQAASGARRGALLLPVGLDMVTVAPAGDVAQAHALETNNGLTPTQLLALFAGAGIALGALWRTAQYLMSKKGFVKDVN